MKLLLLQAWKICHWQALFDYLFLMVPGCVWYMFNLNQATYDDDGDDYAAAAADGDGLFPNL